MCGYKNKRFGGIIFKVEGYYGDNQNDSIDNDSTFIDEWYRTGY